MTKKYSEDIHDYVEPFYINGLEGRMLKAGTKTSKTKQILYVYDILDSLENSWGIIENLRSYGNVTAVDLPGVGGMTYFSKIEHPITIDAYADYLAAFIKLSFKRKKLVIVAKGFGFVAITRMLLKYPILSDKIKTVINIGGEVHNDDLQLTTNKKKVLAFCFDVFSLWPISFITKKILMNERYLGFMSNIIGLSNYQNILRFNNMLLFEEHLKIIRKIHMTSYWRLMSQLVKLDNCTYRINVPLKHAYIQNFGFTNYTTQKQHMMIAYKNYRAYEIHVPKKQELSSKKTDSYLLPKSIKRALATAKA